MLVRVRYDDSGLESAMILTVRPSRERSWPRRAWEVASDLIIATALIWTIPLLLAVALAVVRLMQRAL